jgi:zinc/manganese transport system permease protein
MLSLTPGSGIFEYAFMRNAFLAGTLVAIVAGVVGYFVVLRRLAFAGHALAHIGFAGATGAVLLNINLFVGLAAFTTGAGIAMGILGDKLRGRDVAIGTVLALTMGLGNLFLTLSTKLAGEATSILFGDLLAISSAQVQLTLGFAAATLLVLAGIYRPLLFASVDPEVAETRGVPVRALGVVFMILLALTVAQSVQVVGVLLIFSLLVTPAATAQLLTARPAVAIASSVGVAVLSVWLGLLLAYQIPWPPSAFITMISFGLYLGVRLLAPRVDSLRWRTARTGLQTAP